MSVYAFLRRTTGLAVAAVLVAAAASCALAASFSADVVMKMQGTTQSGRTYVDGKRTRMEMSHGPMKTIVIVRADKGVTWMLMPEQRQYMENRAGSKDWTDPNWLKNMEQHATKKYLGKANVAGYTCDKYLYEFKKKEMGSSTIYLAKKLDYPIKIENKSQFGSSTVELKNIKEGKQAASLFEIPKGYKKVEMPPMPMGGMPKPPAKPR